MEASLTHCFIRLQTEQDLWDVIALLRRGVKVCVEPVPGTIFGPVNPCQFATEMPIKSTVVRRMSPVGGLEDFLRAYLPYDKRYHVLLIDAVHPVEGVEPIRAAWEILNYGADHPLSAVGIAKLVSLCARVYGGEVEFQLPYGHPEWQAWVKGGIGHLNLWHQPSVDELSDLIEYGCRGLVRADAHRDWYRGGLDFAMPDRGTLSAGEMPIADAYEAAGGPSGLGGTWDRVRTHYRLMGLLCGPEIPPMRRNEIRVEARRHSIKTKRNWPKLVITAHGECAVGEPAPEVDRLHLTISDPATTAAWLHANWSNLKVVTFKTKTV